MRWRRLVPWKPLPRPSRRMTMVLKELTSTVVQSTWNCSVTIWPPGVPSLTSTSNPSEPGHAGEHLIKQKLQNKAKFTITKLSFSFVFIWFLINPLGECWWNIWVTFHKLCTKKLLIYCTETWHFALFLTIRHIYKTKWCKKSCWPDIVCQNQKKKQKKKLLFTAGSAFSWVLN